MSLLFKECGKIIQAERDIGMVGTECLLADRKRLPSRSNGISRAALPIELNCLTREVF
jgi:hypothetical protein